MKFLNCRSFDLKRFERKYTEIQRFCIKIDSFQSYIQCALQILFYGLKFVCSILFCKSYVSIHIILCHKIFYTDIIEGSKKKKKINDNTIIQ